MGETQLVSQSYMGNFDTVNIFVSQKAPVTKRDSKTTLQGGSSRSDGPVLSGLVIGGRLRLVGRLGVVSSGVGWVCTSDRKLFPFEVQSRSLERDSSYTCVTERGLINKVPTFGDRLRGRGRRTPSQKLRNFTLQIPSSWGKTRVETRLDLLLFVTSPRSDHPCTSPLILLWFLHSW